MNKSEILLYGKLPPQAIEVEEAVLGALMLESDTIRKVQDYIDTFSFYKNEHQIIFETIKLVFKEKKQVDLLMITTELHRKNKLDEVGGAAFITKLTSKVASAAHIEHHAKIIAEKYYLREIIRRSSDLIELAYNETEIYEISEQLKADVLDLDNIFTVTDSGTHIKDVLVETVREIENDCVLVQDNKTPGITTGFQSLDNATGGWRNGNMIILAARPGIGKTSLALQFSIDAAKTGKWVNIFSFEMLKTDLARILISFESNVTRSNIRDGNLTIEDWNKINETVNRLRDYNIIFKDSGGMSIKQIESTIHRNKKIGKCDIAIIDYVQLIKPLENRNKSRNREQEISEISRNIKVMSLNEKIPVIALAQLSREAENMKPKLSHLRESGSLEQDSDLVLFLSNSENNNEKILTVAKNRRGRNGDTIIYCNDENTKFSDYNNPTNQNNIF